MTAAASESLEPSSYSFFLHFNSYEVRDAGGRVHRRCTLAAYSSLGGKGRGEMCTLSRVPECNRLLYLQAGFNHCSCSAASMHYTIIIIIIIGL